MRGVMEGSGSSSSSFSSVSHSSPSPSVFHNYPLISSILAFAIAQSIKFFTTWYKERRWDAKQLIGSGGMPSSHSATVTALAVAVGIQEGLRSSTFATATILASVFYMGCLLVFPVSNRLFVIIFTWPISFWGQFSSSRVMHDAFGVRLHAGRQAEVLNQIVYELPEEHPLSDARPLRELLGHTPLQVIAGAILGCIVAAIAQLINKLAGAT